MAKTSKEVWIKYLTGKTLGQYELLSYEGGGEYGLVFSAKDISNNAPYAIKVLAPGARAFDVLEFEDEGRFLRKLKSSSNVVEYFGSAEEDFAIDSAAGIYIPLQYHILELAVGSLDELLIDDVARRSISWPDRLQLWRAAIKGVHQMHLKGLVHRDIKSSNFLLFRHGGSLTCKVGDLGKTRDMSERARLSAITYAAGRGDFRFAPPECLFLQAGDSEVAFRSADLYSLGSLLCEIATGQGATSVAVGFGPQIFQESMQDFKVGIRRDLSGLRQQYKRVSSLLATEVPPRIRDRAVTLIGQLCDPVPDRRFPVSIPNQRVNQARELSWLLREVDIMIKLLSAPPKQGRQKYRVQGRVR